MTRETADHGCEGVRVPLKFGPLALAAGQFGALMPTAIGEGSHASDSYVAPWPGSIAALGGALAEPIPSALELVATINGGPVPATAVELAAGKTNRAVILGPALVRFAARDRIGCAVTTGVVWGGDGAELLTAVAVRYEPEGI